MNFLHKIKSYRLIYTYTYICICTHIHRNDGFLDQRNILNNKIQQKKSIQKYKVVALM